MAVAALVLTLDPDPALRRGALEALATAPWLTLGSRDEVRVPGVLEADSPWEIEPLFEQVRDVPGVLAVELVAAWMEDPEALEGGRTT